MHRNRRRVAVRRVIATGVSRARAAVRFLETISPLPGRRSVVVLDIDDTGAVACLAACSHFANMRHAVHAVTARLPSAVISRVHAARGGSEPAQRTQQHVRHQAWCASLNSALVWAGCKTCARPTTPSQSLACLPPAHHRQAGSSQCPRHCPPMLELAPHAPSLRFCGSFGMHALGASGWRS